MQAKQIIKTYPIIKTLQAAVQLKPTKSNINVLIEQASDIAFKRGIRVAEEDVIKLEDDLNAAQNDVARLQLEIKVMKAARDMTLKMPEPEMRDLVKTYLKHTDGQPLNTIPIVKMVKALTDWSTVESKTYVDKEFEILCRTGICRAHGTLPLAEPEVPEPVGGELEDQQQIVDFQPAESFSV